MICGWLINIGFVKKQSSKYSSNIDNERKITGFLEYSITAKGSHALKQSKGNSSNSQQEKFIMWEFLAIKGVARDYTRTKKALILKYLEESLSFKNLLNHLKHKGFEESEEIIKNDIQGLNNIGIRINIKENTVKLLDKINDFKIPDINLALSNNDKQRLKLKEYFIQNTNLLEKFINLLDIAYDAQANRDVEIISTEFIRDEYKLKAQYRCGNCNPHALIWTILFGVIVDIKTYCKGYKMKISATDKMFRYVNENI